MRVGEKRISSPSVVIGFSALQAVTNPRLKNYVVRYGRLDSW